MAGIVVAGVQLPPDSTGRITGGYQITVAGQTVTLPASVIVDSNGNEVGGAILATLDALLLEAKKQTMQLGLLLAQFNVNEWDLEGMVS